MEFVFNYKREDVAGACRKLHNTECRCVFITIHDLADQIKEYEVGALCSTYKGEEKFTRFCLGNLKEGDICKTLV
jgi:hypothetical protein